MARKEPLIGLEVTRGQVRLVEMTTSLDGLEVTNFAIVDIPPGPLNLLGPRLKDTLRARGFQAKRFNAFVPSTSVEYLQLSLPPMSRSDMEKAMAREARKDIKFPEQELVYNYEVVGESEEKGVRRTEVLLGRMNRRDLQDFLLMSKDSGLRFNALTLAPAVLLNLLRMRGGGLREETVAVIYLGIDKGIISILQQGTLRFPRDFPLRLGAEPPDLAGRLVAEVKRSLLQLKQRARGLEANRIVLLGELKDPYALVETLQKETGVKTELYAPMGLDLSPLDDRVEEFRESLSYLSLALGLAWDGPGHSQLNLLADIIAERRRLNAAKIGVTSLGLILGLLLIIQYVFLAQKMGPLKRDLADSQRELNILRPQAKDITQREVERNLQKSRHAFLGKVEGPGVAWSEILRILSHCVPEELLLEFIEIKEAEEGWTLRIKGGVLGKDADLVRKRYTEFLSLFLTSCPCLEDCREEAFSIGPLGGARLVEASELKFTVSMSIKTQEAGSAFTKR